MIGEFGVHSVLYSLSNRFTLNKQNCIRHKKSISQLYHGIPCQEPLLKAAGIPCPEGFDGSKQSFTLKGADDNQSSVGVLQDTQCAL